MSKNLGPVLEPRHKVKIPKIAMSHVTDAAIYMGFGHDGSSNTYKVVTVEIVNRRSLETK